jgi:hypothetical protein
MVERPTGPRGANVIKAEATSVTSIFLATFFLLIAITLDDLKMDRK